MREDGRARRAVVKQLGESADPGAIATLLELFERETAVSLRLTIRVALTRQARRHHDRVLAAAWAGRSDGERLCLLEALTVAKSPAVCDLWIEYFVRHPLAGYRARAASGLQRLADPRGTPYLFELARDPEAAPRRAAVAAFGAVRADGMLAPVIDALWDPERDVQWAAHGEVRKFGRAGWDALVAAIHARGGSHGAIQAVGWCIQIDGGEPLFHEALADSAAPIRLGALEVLNSWTTRSSPALCDAIARAAADPDLAVRTRAVLALRWFARTPAARAALEAARTDADPAVRVMAADSIARRRDT